MGVGDDGRDAVGGVAREEIVRELVREPKGSDGRSEKGEVGERGDPRAIDELRRYVCRVLGVDPKVEGESVVPSNGVGSSATRVHWARVGAICRSWRDGEASEDDGANEANEANEADQADQADQADEADADDLKLTAAQERDLAIGRIGPRRVAVDRASASGDMHLGDGPHGPNTSVSSRSNFCSFRANACVFGGRWQYEVTIRTAGIMQIGWATARCPFTQEHGVGDAQDSYAFDGHRVRKWNVACQPYGQPWVPGDVITCCIDLTADEDGGGTVSYLRNGVSMGVAFRNVRRSRPGLAYFPAVSLSVNEAMDLNFGASPMRYPREGHAPLLTYSLADVAPAWRKSVEAFGRLCAFGGVGDPAPCDDATYRCEASGTTYMRQSGTPALLTRDDEVMLACATLQAAGPAEGAGEDDECDLARRWLIGNGRSTGLIRTVTRAGERRRVDEFERTMRLLRVGLYDDRFQVSRDVDGALRRGPQPGDEFDYVNFSNSEYALFVGELTRALAEEVRSTPFLEEPQPPSRRMSSIEREAREKTLPSHSPLAFAVAIARDCTARSAWMSHAKWHAELEDLLTWKSPSPRDLEAMLPASSVWWPGAAASEAVFRAADGGGHAGGRGSEQRCKAAGLKLRAAMSRSCALHCGLIDAVWDHRGRAWQAGSGKCVLMMFGSHGQTWLDELLAKNVPGQRGRARRTDPCVMGALYFAMLALIRPELENPTAPEWRGPGIKSGLGKWDPNGYYNSMAHRFDLPLFGGGVSHVQKEYPTDTSAPWLEIDASGLQPAVGLGSDVLNWSDAGLPPLKWHVAYANAWNFDAIQFMYHLAVGAQYRSAAAQLQTQIQAAKHLEEYCENLPKVEAAHQRHNAQTRIMTQLQSISNESSSYPPGERASEAFIQRLRTALTEARQLASQGLVSDEVAGAIAAATRDLQERYDVALVDEGAEVTAAADEARESASVFIGELKEEIVKLRDEVVESSRVCWWHRATLHRPEQQAGMFAAAAYQARLILAAMERGGEPRKPPSDTDNEDEDGDGDGDDGGGVSSTGDSGDEEEEEEEEEEEHAEAAGGDGSELEGSVERENVDTDDDDDENDDENDDTAGRRSVPGVATKKGALLQHIPAYHLEALIDSFHALRRGDPPYAPVAPDRAAASPGLHGVVKLLVRHFADERVVNPDVRDMMLQSVSVLLQYKEYVAVFEANEEARREMVPSLLRSFDSRFWIPVSNILLRLCKGVGFGQYDNEAIKVLAAIKAIKRDSADRHRETGNVAVVANEDDGGEDDHAASPDAALAEAIANSVDSSSPLFQALIVETFKGDPKLLEKFLDRVFNTLNWTITEFGVALKEMLDMRQRAAAARNLQRKCTVMLELSVTLERVLEFLTLELPVAFLDSSASMRMKRLVEILLFVLGHTCGAGSDAKLFEQALSMKLPVFVADKISRAPVLAPIAGIILNLEVAAAAWVEGRGDEFGVNEVSDTVADELAAGAGENNISQLEYICAFDWEEHFGAFTGREEAIAELRDVVRRVRDTREDIERRRKAEDEVDVPEDFVDPIMQSVMTDPVTLPGSGVVVDRETIRRHLLTGDGTDPFSRTPLDESMLRDATDLRKKIDEWRSGLHKNLDATALEDID